MRDERQGALTRVWVRIALVLALVSLTSERRPLSEPSQAAPYPSFVATLEALVASGDELVLELDTGPGEALSPHRLVPGGSEPQGGRFRGRIRHWSMSERLRGALGRLEFEVTESTTPCREGLHVNVRRGDSVVMLFVLEEEGSVCWMVAQGLRLGTLRLRPVGNATEVLYEAAIEFLSPVVPGTLSLKESCVESARRERAQ